MISMRVVIVAPGSRGDVAPYTGLGARLSQAGHDVTISAHAPFRDLVEGAGLAFHQLPGDLLAVISVPSSDRPPSPRFLSGRINELNRYLHDVGQGALAAAEAADTLLVNSTAPFAYHVAEGLGLPSMGVYLQPFEPTGDFASVLTTSARSLGRHGNRIVGELLLTMAPFHRAAAELRAQLGLAQESARVTRRRQAAAQWPVFHGYSPAVLPRPKDWRAGLEVTGYWWPQDLDGWTPPETLREFLAAGSPPVLITFGSMAAGAGPWLSELVAAAVRRAGVRAVVQTGAAELAVEPGDDVLPLGSAPHSWLFPRMAAVVHHGGAGTTGAGVRAGVPTVITPIYADQPLWGRRIAELGLGPRPIPFTRLTADRLAASIREAVTEPAYRAAAQAVAARIRAEDGAAPVVDAVNRLAD